MLALTSEDPRPPVEPSTTVAVKRIAPPHRAPSSRDPGGNPERIRRLPPRGKLFGFSDSTFAATGALPEIDQGVTPEQQTNDMVAAGANAARITLSWTDLEPERGTYNQDYVRRLKSFTDRFEAAGGKVLIVLGVPPRWARAEENSPTSAPVDRPDVLQAYTRAAAFVARTWPAAAGIETWNEPNVTTFWKPYEPEPERFAAWHKAAARAIRAQAQHPPVVLAGLAPFLDDTDGHLSAQTFLKRMFDAGLKPADYDAIGSHLYPLQDDGRVEALDRGTFARQVSDVRLGVRWADADAPLWITETGISTTGPDAVGPARQGGAVTRSVRKLLAMPDVDAVFVHTLYDPRQFEDDSRETGFGLLQTRDPGAPARPKPGWCILASLTARPAARQGCP